MKELTKFQSLLEKDVSKHTEKKNGLTYLSWTYAWAQFKQEFPEATYTIRHWDGCPYWYNESLGYMVETSISTGTEELSMWLPVMDGANRAMKAQLYTYKTKSGEKTVEAATMFDINTAIMRCLVKNIAMFGLGLYIYAGEDLPQDSEATIENKKQIVEQAKIVDLRNRIAGWFEKVPAEANIAELKAYENFAEIDDIATLMEYGKAVKAICLQNGVGNANL